MVTSSGGQASYGLQRLSSHLAAFPTEGHNCRRIALNERQKMYPNTVLDQGIGFEGHIKRPRYARVTANVAGKISDATAKRDLLDMKDKGILISVATTGRNAGYQINPALLKRTS